MISVVIPTYNGLDVLWQSLPTWMDQSLSSEEYEVIVVDNRSTDGTRAEVEKMIDGRPNFRYLYEPQQGATAARHAGTRVSKGDILVFADNDGLFNKECLEKIKEVYEMYPEVEAVTGKIELLWDQTPPEWISQYEFMLGKLNYGEEVAVKEGFYLNGGLMSVRKATFERLHGFNPDLVGNHLIGDGDTGFVKKLFKEHCLIGYTPFAVMQHMQKVSVHGSVQGIARHFYNNGTAESYALFREHHFKMTKEVRVFRLGQVLAYIKKGLQYYVLGRKERHIFFSLQQRKGSLKFFEYLRDHQLAELIKVENVY